MSELIYIPGAERPSRELMALWRRFHLTRYMIEIEGPDGSPGWLCATQALQYVASDWSWREQLSGYWLGSPITTEASPVMSSTLPLSRYET